MQRIIGYVRVSTDKQGQSGLGLEAQQAAIAIYAEAVGGDVLKVYREVETGKNNQRAILTQALAHARRSQAVLAVAVLDRIGRDSLMINQLLAAGVEFVDCQSPHDPPMVTRIKAAIAQDEREKISQRTKQALAAYKARGGKLGSARPECRDNLSQVGRERGAYRAGMLAAVRARESYEDIAPVMREWRSSGESYGTIARRLNAEGHTTRHGRPWTATQANRVLAKYA